MFVCSMSLFTSCNDDDDNNGEGPQLGRDIAGTYNGTLAMVASEAKTSRQQVFITQVGANEVSLDLKNISINIEGADAPIEIDAVQFPNVVVEGDNTLAELKESKATVQSTLGEIEVTAAGTVASQKLNLNFSVNVKVEGEGDKSIDVAFVGEKLSSEVDMKDYAQELAGWYARKELTVTGIDLEPKWPTDGIEVVYNKYNQISIKPFYITFPYSANDTRQIEIKSARLIKTATSVEIEDIHQALTDNRGDATLDLSGKFEDGVLTLNMTITNAENTAHYVFTADQKKTGAIIEKMTINSDVVTVQPEIGEVASNKANIVFYIKDGTSSDKLSLVPEFEISSGATLYYGDAAYVKGTAIDFSKEQTFKVTAESGKTTVTYTVTSEELTEFDFLASFDEDWKKEKFSTVEYEEPGNGWVTSNGGVAYIKAFDFFLHCYSASKPNAVLPVENAGGKAARLETLNTTGKAPMTALGMPAVPKVTSGTVFNGAFVVNTSNTLKSTLFGSPCFKKPVTFKGSYKFTAGETYYVCADPAKANEVKEDATKKDLPAINAVLYEVNSYAFDFLDGTNLLTSKNIVAIASVADAKEQAEYTNFNVNFTFKEGKSFDATKKYKLAIVCSSSKDGDKFSGAPGSVLYVDDLEVTF